MTTFQDMVGCDKATSIINIADDKENDGYDSDAPISRWAGKRPLGTVIGNVYNVHVGSSKKPRTTEKHDPEVAAYLAAISGTK